LSAAPSTACAIVGAWCVAASGRLTTNEARHETNPDLGALILGPPGASDGVSVTDPFRSEKNP
jgi:hypothetical protein